MHHTKFKKILEIRQVLTLLFVGSVLLFTSTYTTHAQVSASFGVKASVAATTFQGDNSDDINNFYEAGTPSGIDLGSSLRIGYGGGLFAEFRFDDLEAIALRPEVGYMQRGDMIEDDSGSTTYSLTTKVDYIEVPVLLRVNLPNDLYAIVGPSVGFSIGTPEIELENLVFIDTGEETRELDSDAIASTVYGVVVGFGVGIDNAWLDLRYHHGLSDVFDPPTGFQPDIQNQGLSLSFGYGF